MGIADLKLPDQLGALAKATPPSTILEDSSSRRGDTSSDSRNKPGREPILGRFAGVFKGYGSLEAACLAAVDGSTIELRFDGKSAPQKPVRIEGKSLRIRAQVGKRPTLIFEVPEAIGQSPPSSMITVINGAVELFDATSCSVFREDARPTAGQSLPWSKPND